MDAAPMSANRLPDFIIIGAAKSATTWLVRNLQQHPDLYIPRIEVHYFSRHHDKGMAWYQSHFVFAKRNQIVGERSNTYFSCTAASRLMKEILPSVKLIAQLRNPIDRAYSDYCMSLRQGYVSSAVESYLDLNETSLPQFIEDGFYYKHIARFLEYYPRENLAVLIYDDIVKNPNAFLRQAYRHIGIVLQESTPNPIEERIYDKQTPEINPKLRRLLQPVRPVLDPFMHRPWMRSLRSRFGMVPEYPHLTAAIRDKLATLYRSDVDRLSELIGRDLSYWLAPDESANL